MLILLQGSGEATPTPHPIVISGKSGSNEVRKRICGRTEEEEKLLRFSRFHHLSDSDIPGQASHSRNHVCNLTLAVDCAGLLW